MCYTRHASAFCLRLSPRFMIRLVVDLSHHMIEQRIICTCDEVQVGKLDESIDRLVNNVTSPFDIFRGKTAG